MNSMPVQVVIGVAEGLRPPGPEDSIRLFVNTTSSNYDLICIDFTRRLWSTGGLTKEIKNVQFCVCVFFFSSFIFTLLFFES